MKIYVSAASAELERAERFIAAARVAGLVVTEDWTVPFRRHLDGEPVDASQVAADDLNGVFAADVLVVLIPKGEATSRGLWVELGFAFAEGKSVIAVGDPEALDIWGCMCAFVATEDEALRVLGGMAEGRRLGL